MRWDLGVDLGTRNVRMATLADGPVLAAPSAVLLRDGREQPIAAGEAAYQLFGRTAPDTQVCFPLRDGALANNLYAEKLLKWLLNQSDEKKRGRRARVLISCASFARPVQREALLLSAVDAGAGEVALVRSDAAMAVGAGLKLLEPQASLVVDLGAGKLTATLFTRGLVAAGAHLPYGMNRIDARIQQLLQARDGFLIGPKTACEIKEAFSHAAGDAAQGVEMRAAGIRACSRLPEYVDVTPDTVTDAMEDVLHALTEMCQSVIDNAPEELAADLNDAGAVLVGGGARIPGLDKRIGDRLGIPCRVADAPEACGVVGLYEMMKNPDLYEDLFLQKMIKNVRH